MANAKNYEPEKLIAGENWEWNKELSDYPATLWTLYYTLRIRDQDAFVLTATADGTTHKISADSVATANVTPGVHEFIGYVEEIATPANRFVVFNRTLEVTQNPFATGFQYDPRTHPEKVVDLIKTAMEGRIPDGYENYSIGGRSISKIPLSELRALYDQYRQDVEMEKQAEAIASGRGNKRNIFVRFK